MATPVEKIFNKFLYQIDDIELTLIEEDEFENILMQYLENSIIEFCECDKEITIVPSYKKEYNINSHNICKLNSMENNFDDGLDEGFNHDGFNRYSIKIPKQDQLKFKLYAILKEEVIPPEEISEDNNNSKIGLIEDTDYTLFYNEDEEILYIKIMLLQYENIIIESYYDAYIIEDLQLQEIYILASSMVLFWLNVKIRREENLRQLLNDRDYKQLSSANMVAKLIDLYKHTKQELELSKQKYVLSNFKGFD